LSFLLVSTGVISEQNLMQNKDTVTYILVHVFLKSRLILFVSPLGCASASMVFLRQKQLDHKMYQRIQRQIAAGV
jgi:hypothetical protein